MEKLKIVAEGPTHYADGGMKIPPPLDRFGSTPETFILGFIRQFKTKFSSIHDRVARRTGSTEWIVDVGGSKVRLNLRKQSRDNTNTTALKTLSAAILFPRVFADEALRVFKGESIGHGQGLDTVEFQKASDWQQARHLFGVDDILLITIAVPIITTLAPIVIGWFLSTQAQDQKEGKTSAAITSGDAVFEDDAAPSDDDKWKWIVGGLVGLVALGGAIYLYKHKGA